MILQWLEILDQKNPLVVMLARDTLKNKSIFSRKIQIRNVVSFYLFIFKIRSFLDKKIKAYVMIVLNFV